MYNGERVKRVDTVSKVNYRLSTCEVSKRELVTIFVSPMSDNCMWQRAKAYVAFILFCNYTFV